MSDEQKATSETTSSKKTSDSATRKKTKKKKAKPREGVPLFAQTYPRHEKLDALLDAFERGNYALVREDAAKLLSSTNDAAVRLATEDLLRRLEPDPLARYLLGTSTLLLVFFSIWYFTHRLGP